MRKIKSLLAIPIVVGSMTLMVPPSQAQGVADMVKVRVGAEKAIQKAEKEARKAAEEKIHMVGGCAGTREGCNPEKKIKKLLKGKILLDK